MSRRISVSRGFQDMSAKDLSRHLTAIRRDYRGHLISKERAKERGRRVIEDEFEVLLRMSHDRVRWSLKRPVELPPEERSRLERIRDEYIADFNRIIDDIK